MLTQAVNTRARLGMHQSYPRLGFVVAPSTNPHPVASRCGGPEGVYPEPKKKLVPPGVEPFYHRQHHEEKTVVIRRVLCQLSYGFLAERRWDSNPQHRD